MRSSNRSKNYSLIALAILGGSLLSSPEVSAQTAIGLRLGQPEEVTLGVDGRITLDVATFSPVNQSNFSYATGPVASGGSVEPFRMAGGTSITQAPSIPVHTWS